MYCYIHGWIYTCIRYIHVCLHSQFNEADILLHISSHELHAYIEYEGDDLWSQLQLQTVCVLKLHYREKATIDDIGLQKYEQNWSLQMHNNSMHLAWQKDPTAK